MTARAVGQAVSPLVVTAETARPKGPAPQEIVVGSATAGVVGGGVVTVVGVAAA